ncbi:hypothetical protein MLD38_035298 [Melastoma candidum]|uniref:Uncharacterized protein n=1 Tax=Melastoma candidum TaxID=119954 RepID=A0ACB9MG71_9MYRT|nr:hypothetical protein MLD38_035298 [Melastoma candidum]
MKPLPDCFLPRLLPPSSSEARFCPFALFVPFLRRPPVFLHLKRFFKKRKHNKKLCFCWSFSEDHATERDSRKLRDTVGEGEEVVGFCLHFSIVRLCAMDCPVFCSPIDNDVRKNVAFCH